MGGNISLSNHLLSILAFVCSDKPGDEEDHMPKSVTLIVYASKTDRQPIAVDGPRLIGHS